MFKQITALWCQCEACSHEWITRDIPKRCARCKSRKWNNGERIEETQNGFRVETSPSKRSKGSRVVRERRSRPALPRKADKSNADDKPKQETKSKRLSLEAFSALTNSDQMRAQREGRAPF